MSAPRDRMGSVNNTIVSNGTKWNQIYDHSDYVLNMDRIKGKLHQFLILPE